MYKRACKAQRYMLYSFITPLSSTIFLDSEIMKIPKRQNDLRTRICT
jgi:hypothetical protein